jgi:hypothetical protein
VRGRLAPLAVVLLVPAIVAAGSIKAANMFEKIISVHGTYLESTEPMECGSDSLSPEQSVLTRQWFQRVAGWPNFRHMYPMGTWATDVQACRPPRTSAECLAALDAAGVPYEPVDHAHGVITAVRITGPVGGVKFESAQDLIVDCELAARLPAMATVLRAREITAVGVLSSHRSHAEYSFHALGLALDVNWMKATHWQRAMWLKTDFERTPELHTCQAKPELGMGRVLLGAACDLWQERVMNTVITPNYNEGHANHFHFDVRPGDNRFFVR